MIRDCRDLDRPRFLRGCFISIALQASILLMRPLRFAHAVWLAPVAFAPDSEFILSWISILYRATMHVDLVSIVNSQHTNRTACAVAVRLAACQLHPFFALGIERPDTFPALTASRRCDRDFTSTHFPKVHQTEIANHSSIALSLLLSTEPLPSIATLPNTV
jgi:hypothetical protein